MNKHNIRKRLVLLIIALLIITVAIYVYALFESGAGRPYSISSPTYTNRGLFRIDPGAILTLLDEAGSKIFLPDSRSIDDRNVGPVLYTEPISWSQSDNLKVVSAVNNYVWKDTFDNWKLFRMVFNVDCGESMNGLPGGVFTYFKTAWTNGKFIDTWREVEIDPYYAYVAWGRGAEFPHPFFGWSIIDLNSLNINAEDAIKIAEENGGREARLRVQNKCNIHLTLMPERFHGWVVSYQSAGLEIQIEDYTGLVLKAHLP